MGRRAFRHMFNSLVVAESSPNPGWDVGQRLVAGYFTGEHSLSCTVEVLGQAFLAHPELQEVETLEGKVVSLLGAVADGYATALRTRTLNQQEKVKQALLKAGRDAERGWQVSEAKFRVVEHQGRGMKAYEVLRAAEAARHSAKSGGRRQWKLFDAHHNADHRVRCRLAAAMHSAWRRNEISMDYATSRTQR
ncbi:MAG: hypothetical protein ACRDRU_23580 [Pseudonocardiaceae bacterium]